MADIQHKRVAFKLKQACEETAAQAIEATTASGQASRIHGKNRKFGSRKEAMAAKARRQRCHIAAAKAKREAKEAADK
ncbi:ATP-binding cassette (ABC) Superfamily [Phytophthora palmivora]|uniref:ATP-binding cassette (ABC) Superfamily n=1 Tax=Phytophthora palmivora TaxID=4796 RepID=A0A2P4Y0X1_9STRA|nr:ATP-binding cassette (ABC) Superfamily [Phytophthora palmivora]POM72456.1 ATP-binding cassette (ABC) Superfamily [Phytophthora palmivora]